MKMSKTIGLTIFMLLVITGIVILMNGNKNHQPGDDKKSTAKQDFDSSWVPVDISTLDHSPESELIRYGRELIANTSYYLGPNGKVAKLTNGMNCQNCHLEAGTRIWGNNYSGVYPMYPMYRERSGAIETIHKRVSDCIERSLNGKVPDSASREMRALETYIAWVGKNVPSKTKPKGAGIKELPYLSRPADAVKGKIVYTQKCQRCHGADGEGQKNMGEGSYFIYPPLWGKESYNTAAGLFRISRFAGYVKANMPFDMKTDTAISVEESWDVAAFVNSQPRPFKFFKEDWPNIAKKPVDHPFGPYADQFNEQQHKYGPFAEIKKAREMMNKK